MGNDRELRDFEAVKNRLEEIAQAVSDESMPLDDALDLYEEAVALGLKASDLLEEGIAVDEAALEAEIEAEVEATSTAAGAQSVEGGQSTGVDGEPTEGASQSASASSTADLQ